MFQFKTGRWTLQDARKMVGDTPQGMINWMRRRRSDKARRIVQMRKILIDSGVARVDIRNLVNRCISLEFSGGTPKPTPDYLWDQACRFAYNAKENSRYAAAGNINHLPCGADDGWMEANIDGNYCMAVIYCLASQIA